MGQRITMLRAEAKEKWRPASGGEETTKAEAALAIAEPPPAPKKPKRVFDV
jgi:hypothetical protein